MIPFLSQMQPEEFTKQLIEMNRKVIKGIEPLHGWLDAHVW